MPCWVRRRNAVVNIVDANLQLAARFAGRHLHSGHERRRAGARLAAQRANSGRRQLHVRQRRSRKLHRPAERRRFAGQRRFPQRLCRRQRHRAGRGLPDGRPRAHRRRIHQRQRHYPQPHRPPDDGWFPGHQLQSGSRRRRPGLFPGRNLHQRLAGDLRWRRVQHHQRRLQSQPCTPLWQNTNGTGGSLDTSFATGSGPNGRGLCPCRLSHQLAVGGQIADRRRVHQHQRFCLGPYRADERRRFRGHQLRLEPGGQ